MTALQISGLLLNTVATASQLASLNAKLQAEGNRSATRAELTALRIADNEVRASVQAAIDAMPEDAAS